MCIKCEGTGSHCVVRGTVDESWTAFATNGRSSFLTGLPDLSNTPPEQLTSADDVDDVIGQFDSEASRIASSTKMRSLVKHHNEVYRTRPIKFHWDLYTIVETCHVRSDTSTETCEEVGAVTAPTQKSSEVVSYDYPIKFIYSRMVKENGRLHSFLDWGDSRHAPLTKPKGGEVVSKMVRKQIWKRYLYIHIQTLAVYRKWQDGGVGWHHWHRLCVDIVHKPDQIKSLAVTGCVSAVSSEMKSTHLFHIWASKFSSMFHSG